MSKWKKFKKPITMMMAGAMVFGGLTGPAANHVMADEQILAFDTAEGGGKYATGGRGYDTYVVTSLEDYAD